MTVTYNRYKFVCGFRSEAAVSEVNGYKSITDNGCIT
jgi:hypothetical protein